MLLESECELPVAPSRMCFIKPSSDSDLYEFEAPLEISCSNKFPKFRWGNQSPKEINGSPTITRLHAWAREEDGNTDVLEIMF